MEEVPGKSLGTGNASLGDSTHAVPAPGEYYNHTNLILELTINNYAISSNTYPLELSSRR